MAAAKKCAAVVICDFPTSEDCLTAMKRLGEIGLKLSKEYKLCVILIETDGKPESKASCDKTERLIKGVDDDRPVLDSWNGVVAALKEKLSQAKEAGRKLAQTTTEEFEKYAKEALGKSVDHTIVRMYKGPSIQKTLEFVMDNEQGLRRPDIDDRLIDPVIDMLIVPVLDMLIVRNENDDVVRNPAATGTDAVRTSSSSKKKQQSVDESSSLKLPAGCSIVLVAAAAKKDAKKGKKERGGA